MIELWPQTGVDVAEGARPTGSLFRASVKSSKVLPVGSNVCPRRKDNKTGVGTQLSGNPIISSTRFHSTWFLRFLEVSEKCFYNVVREPTTRLVAMSTERTVMSSLVVFQWAWYTRLRLQRAAKSKVHIVPLNMGHRTGSWSLITTGKTVWIM